MSKILYAAPHPKPPRKRWWVGARSKCTSCGTIWLTEEDDKVTLMPVTTEFNQPVVEVVCPVCKNHQPLPKIGVKYGSGSLIDRILGTASHT